MDSTIKARLQISKLQMEQLESYHQDKDAWTLEKIAYLESLVWSLEK